MRLCALANQTSQCWQPPQVALATRQVCYGDAADGRAPPRTRSRAPRPPCARTVLAVGPRSGREEHLLVWLLLIDSEAFEVPMELVHSTAEFEAGWLVVYGRWFALEQRSPRGYKLRPARRLIVVNTMIRLVNIIFAGGAVGKPPRETRSGLHILDEDMYNLLLESA